MKSKSQEEEFLCWMGNPRYFPKLGVDLKPRMLHKESRVSSSMFGEKKTFDLVIFTFWPKRSQKVSSVSWTRDIAHNKLNSVLRKIVESKNILNKLPLKSIVHLFKINFYCHITLITLLCTHHVYECLHNDHIIKPFPPRDKGCL